ncbi:sigma-70 family RNA polymerase sigma factor [Halosquirtibacter laminarini]|uniref:Sigma-70 family RNA polymerase sigma factor n=1 Tax=Halosquirtibacter laminarini TaxID=3374600 RepID=A0AC61NGE7_9BACT|nr:sigma-70 family RNA polymerase sigma factor [Prolixibacteraceae bacterium]
MDSNEDFIIKYFNQYYDRLCLYSESIVGDIDVAKDIVQELFIYLVEKDKTDRELSSSFFFTSVKHRCISYLRHKKCKERYIEIQIESSSSIFDLEPFQYDELKREFDLCFDLLPERSKEVFTLGKLERVPQKEIEQLLGIKVATIKSHMSKALSILRNCFHKKGIF